MSDDNQLTIRRIFDAPRERVFCAFTDPEELAVWQSVGAFTVEVYTLEPEPGGSLFVTHPPSDD